MAPEREHTHGTVVAATRNSVRVLRVRRTRNELAYEIVFWIEPTYNRRRRAALGKLTPVELELDLVPAEVHIAA